VNVSKDLFGLQIGFKYRVLWLAFSMVIFLWFSYWIFYDVSVWSKPLNQTNPINLVGLVLSIASILSSIIINKLPKRTSVKAEIKAQEQKSVDIGQPVQATQVSQELKQQPKASDIHGCQHSLGYLRKREKSETIPSECLTCKEVIACMSSEN
jgi:hypothetical protein